MWFSKFKMIDSRYWDLLYVSLLSFQIRTVFIEYDFNFFFIRYLECHGLSKWFATFYFKVIGDSVYGIFLFQIPGLRKLTFGLLIDYWDLNDYRLMPENLLRHVSLEHLPFWWFFCCFVLLSTVCNACSMSRLLIWIIIFFI